MCYIILLYSTEIPILKFRIARKTLYQLDIKVPCKNITRQNKKSLEIEKLWFKKEAY